MMRKAETVMILWQFMHIYVYMQPWQNQKMPNLYPNMFKIIIKFLIAFITLCVVEVGFSAVNEILTKKRNAS